MRVELEIDDEFMRRLIHITKETGPADAIRHAVKEYVSHETAERFKTFAGRMQFDPEYLAEREREHPGSVP